MQLQISVSSKIPIYEQIASQVRRQIAAGELARDTLLPSVRTIARDYHISALTVKKAYDLLEQEGYVTTVQGKGTYVNEVSGQIRAEEEQKQLETLFEQAIEQARLRNWSDERIIELVRLLLEDLK